VSFGGKKLGDGQEKGKKKATDGRHDGKNPDVFNSPRAYVDMFVVKGQNQRYYDHYFEAQ
jgi:hypothetical protein